MILGVWDALGAGSAGGWNRRAFQDPFYPEGLTHLGPHFGHFLLFSECSFECISRCPIFPYCERFRGQGLPKREVLGEHFEDFLGVGPQSEN